jgi:hypothetical protein
MVTCKQLTNLPEIGTVIKQLSTGHLMQVVNKTNFFMLVNRYPSNLPGGDTVGHDKFITSYGIATKREIELVEAIYG